MSFDDFSTRVLYLVALSAAGISAVQGDLWWLLRAGEDIWQDGNVPLTDRYSHTAFGDPWPNHEWLWEAAAYMIHRAGGMPLLSLINAVVATCTLVVMRRISPARGYVVPVVIFLALPPLSGAWTIRPQTTTMFLLAAALLLISREKYLPIPFLFLLWANIHGQVALGGLLLAVVTSAALIEFLVDRNDVNIRRLNRLAITTGVSAVATLMTPLGIKLWDYVVQADSRPGQEQIAEWTPAYTFGQDGRFAVLVLAFWAIFLLATLASILRRHHLNCWRHRAPMYAALAMLPPTVLAVRNIPLFLIAAVPLLMTLLEQRDHRSIGQVRHAASVLASAGALAALCVGTIWVKAPPQLNWHPISEDLAASLRTCEGRLYNTYNNGAELIWWVPEVKVFVDNRQDPYSADVIAASSGLDGDSFGTVFRRYNIHCAYLPARSDLAKALTRSGWEQTYNDGTSVVLASTPANRG